MTLQRGGGSGGGARGAGLGNLGGESCGGTRRGGVGIARGSAEPEGVAGWRKGHWMGDGEHGMGEGARVGGGGAQDREGRRTRCGRWGKDPAGIQPKSALAAQEEPDHPRVQLVFLPWAVMICWGPRQVSWRRPRQERPRVESDSAG